MHLACSETACVILDFVPASIRQTAKASLVAPAINSELPSAATNSVHELRMVAAASTVDHQVKVADTLQTIFDAVCEFAQAAEAVDNVPERCLSSSSADHLKPDGVTENVHKAAGYNHNWDLIAACQAFPAECDLQHQIAACSNHSQPATSIEAVQGDDNPQRLLRAMWITSSSCFCVLPCQGWCTVNSILPLAVLLGHLKCLKHHLPLLMLNVSGAISSQRCSASKHAKQVQAKCSSLERLLSLTVAYCVLLRHPGIGRLVCYYCQANFTRTSYRHVRKH